MKDAKCNCNSGRLVRGPWALAMLAAIVKVAFTAVHSFDALDPTLTGLTILGCQ
jgi:hypothetical protein